jgi:hypothetical protein
MSPLDTRVAELASVRHDLDAAWIARVLKLPPFADPAGARQRGRVVKRL